MRKQVICNMRTLGVTEWDMQIGSLCMFNDVFLLSAPIGIAKYVGDTDNGSSVDASFAFSLFDLGNNQLKSLHDFYIYCVTGGDISVDISTDGEAIKTYVEIDGVLDRHTIKVSIGKGHKGTNWFFRIKNMSGDYFKIEKVLLDFLIASRKVFSKVTHIQRYR